MIHLVKYNESSLRLVWADFDVKNNVEYPIFKIRSWWSARCAQSDSFFVPNSCLSGTLKLVRRFASNAPYEIINDQVCVF